MCDSGYIRKSVENALRRNRSNEEEEENGKSYLPMTIKDKKDREYMVLPSI